MIRLAILIFLALGLSARNADSEKNPIEVGNVRWGRDLQTALERSGETGQPIFVLFQEVPGCAGCQRFGADVLTEPLLVEAIEDEFLSVLVYNNRPGTADQELLRLFNEPACNYQVVRFLNADARDIIPRKEHVWTIGGLASRMIEALQAAERTVPNYLLAVAAENDVTSHGVCAFAVTCFWIGEQELGKIEGVLLTEAGWIEGREVTRVTYNRNIMTLEDLAEAAARVNCAERVYVPDHEVNGLERFRTGRLDGRYRKAAASDQKRQIAGWPIIHDLPGLTAMQRTKINAFWTSDRDKALEWLSPRQQQILFELEQAGQGAQ